MRKITPPFLRTQHNYDMNAAGDETALHCTDKTLTQQHQAEEADINTIVRRIQLTGEMPNNIRMPTHGDFTGLTDFHTAMNNLVRAREAFAAMPANVRARFHNDPGEFIDFCSQEENRPEALKMGLVTPQLADLTASTKPALERATNDPDQPEDTIPPKKTPPKGK